MRRLSRGLDDGVDPRKSGAQIMGHHDDYLRSLYKTGRPNKFARLQNRASAAAYAAGLWPRRAAALDVR